MCVASALRKRWSPSPRALRANSQRVLWSVCNSYPLLGFPNAITEIGDAHHCKHSGANVGWA